MPRPVDSLERAMLEPGLTVPSGSMWSLLEEDGFAIPGDPALAAALLRAANADLRGGDRIGCLHRAAERLGVEETRRVLLSVPHEATPEAEDDDAIAFDFVTFRLRAGRASIAARHLASFVGLPPAETATAALLQDVGMIALYRAFGDRYLQVLDIAGPDHRNLAEVEQRTLRIDHAIVAAEMAGRWRLPETTVAAIRHHHRHDGAPEPERPFAAALELATIATMALDDAGLHVEDATVRFRRAARAWFGIGPHEALVLLEEIRAESSHAERQAHGRPPLPEAEVARRLADARRELGVVGAIEPAGAAMTRDETTGLPDRESFLERLDAALGIERRRGSSVAVLILAVDDLRELNGRLGMRGGDALLHEVAQRIATHLPPEGHAFRFVGGQFAALLPGSSPLEARSVADEIRRAVAGTLPETMGERAVRVTLSVGVALDRFGPEVPGADILPVRERILRSALAALARAEAGGRNRTELFRDEREAA